MSISFITFIVIHVLVFAYMVEMLRRIARRHREYPLDESKETLPFGFLSLRYIIILFIMVYVAWFLFSIWLYTYFIEGVPGASTGGGNNAILKL
ncbi:MAG: hypothetical protein OEY44_01315 [Candidatus Peregrinibacteria bacterium]|nr:hypothetical protein [Candidatus Peregrinibacteria bacterium]